jgi:hypothetical protein
MHLPAFGWQPIILAVHEDYYEEALDRNLEAMLPQDLRVEKVKALKVGKPRLVGDVGLRGFMQLYRRAKEIIEREQIDFLYIPIPSFYVALLGRWLHKSTGIAYGIDYIDPWVHTFAGSDKIFSRHWFSTKLAGFLEPVAIKKARLITGVAEGYYKGVQQRNPHLMQQAVFAAMPYGGERTDHVKVKQLSIKPYLFNKTPGKIQLVYAGAMLPKAYTLLQAVLQSIAANPSIFANVEVHFIGTGKSPNDPNGYNIRPYAEKYGLWQQVVFEYPKRIPYLDVLVHLDAADGVFVLGSTEPHYTPSKVYQGVLSGKPVLAILHQASTAAGVLAGSGAGMVIGVDGENGVAVVKETFAQCFEQFLLFMGTYNVANIRMQEFDKYSAYNVTRMLAEALDKAVAMK